MIILSASVGLLTVQRVEQKLISLTIELFDIFNEQKIVNGDTLNFKTPLGLEFSVNVFRPGGGRFIIKNFTFNTMSNSTEPWYLKILRLFKLNIRPKSEEDLIQDLLNFFDEVQGNLLNFATVTRFIE